MQKKYGFLSFAAKVLRIVAWVALVVGVILSIVLGLMAASWANGATSGLASGIAGGVLGFFVGIASAIFTFLTWVFLLATREILYLLMDVEENTRNTAEGVANEAV
jgi:uncharacterized membrane protein